MDIGAALRSDEYLAGDGEELEPVSKSICQRLEARGLFMSGEEVRRLVRKSRMPVQKIDGRLMAKSVDIDRFVVAVVNQMRANAAQRSAAA